MLLLRAKTTERIKAFGAKINHSILTFELCTSNAGEEPILKSNMDLAYNIKIIKGHISL